MHDKTSRSGMASSRSTHTSALPAAPKANPAQQEAILCHTGETLVLAGPGSGKTYVLTAHIETLIERYHVDPSSILVLTFSKAAALSMRARFYKNTEGRYPPISFGTFHSIFYQIIRNGGDDRVTLIEPARRMRLLQELLHQYYPQMTDPDDAGILAEIICRSREQGRPCPKGDFRQPETIGLAVHAYESYLAENHLIDYDGMILLCRDLLRNRPDLRRSIKAQYSYLLVDEFQDISASQYEILRMLYDREPYAAAPCGQAATEQHAAPPGITETGSPPETGRALFVVGDDDQAIYGFRGSDPSICRAFLQDYPDAHQILLSVNYRSVPPIVKTAGLVITQNKNRIHKTIISGRTTPPVSLLKTQGRTHENTRTVTPKAVACKAFADRQEQFGYLAKVVAAMDEATRKESAIICRTNRQLGFVRQALARAGLLPGDSLREENPWIRRVHTLYRGYMAFGMEVQEDRIRRRTYTQIMNVPERFLLKESMPQETMSCHEFLRTYPRGSAQWQSMSALVECAQRLCDLPERQRVRFFRVVIGIEADLIRRANGSTSMRQQIQEAFEHLAEQPSAVFEDTPEEPRTVQRSSAAMSSACGVALLTMHACKGLEYNNVYLPDLNEGMIPTRKAHTPDAIEEERRLFYVAMTRAREHLELLYVQGTTENPCTPTRFLLPLGIGPRYSQ